MPNRKLLVALAIALSAVATSSAQTTLFIVRHAEKATDPGNRNPALSELGQKRAVLLAKMLRSVSLSAVYSTSFDRTTRTVEPTAAAAGLKVTPYESDYKLAEILRSAPAGSAILIAGHSNTIPVLLKTLGVPGEIELADGEYDNLFIVVIGKSGEVSFQRLRYGSDLAL